MSIVDFLLAFVGIILGLGVADLLTSLHKLLRAGSRVKWHWATPTLAALMLGIDLEEFYFSSRIHLWSLMSATLGGFTLLYSVKHWSIGGAQLLAIAWPTLISFSFAVVATLTKRMWVHALAIGWIFTVAVANNLFISIGR